MTLDHVLHLTTTAFDGVRLGEGVSLLKARNPQAAIPRRAAAAMIESGWQDVPEHRVVEYSDGLGLLDAEGFRFYLPAFLRFALRHPRSNGAATACTLHALSSDRGAEDPRYAHLSGEQRAAIVAFLEYTVERSPNEAHRTLANQALPQWRIAPAG